MEPPVMPHFRVIATLVVTACCLRADQGTDFFEAKIRPVLLEHCHACHSADAAKAGKLKGGLRLDTRDGLRKGGDSGTALVPGDPSKGTLLASLRHEGDVRMPPKGVADQKRMVEELLAKKIDGIADLREYRRFRDIDTKAKSLLETKRAKITELEGNVKDLTADVSDKKQKIEGLTANVTTLEGERAEFAPLMSDEPLRGNDHVGTHIDLDRSVCHDQTTAG